MSHLTARIYPDGTSNSFTYTPTGQRATMKDASGTYTYAYDSRDRLITYTTPAGTLHYSYDSNGNVTNLWSSTVGGVNLIYQYNPLNRLTNVVGQASSLSQYSYDLAGSLQDVYYPNGVHAAYQYDVMNRLTNLTHTSSASALLAKYSYVPNTNGWRQAATEILLQVNGTYVTNWLAWGYDNLGRLTNEASSSTLAVLNFTNQYLYDLAGNRLWKTNFSSAGTQVTGYSYNANDQLVTETNSAASFTNSYNANGSLTNRSSVTETNLYSYNLEGRLATAAINQQQTNRYYYNQSGIRTRVQMSGTVNATNIFLNDPQNLSGFSQVLEELPTIGATPTATYTLGSQIISQEKSGTTSHLMADGHGSTRSLTDGSGAVQNTFTYDGYGNLLASNAVLQTAYLYSGERFDSDLQQYYLRARYYNPAVGRFEAMDQVDGTPNDPLSLHKYSYVQNNPMNMNDPSGNDGNLISLSAAMTIDTVIEAIELARVAYTVGSLITESVVANESLDQIEGQPAKPGVDTATIIVHGLNGLYNGQPNGWSKQNKFQDNLGPNPVLPVGGTGLNHDFYEFDWGGMSFAEVLLIPTKIVHTMALLHLKMAEELVSMKGYANIDIISHSWGTLLSYDLQQISGIETHDWVTMGSPLKKTTDKPVYNTGKWVNCYSLNDPVTHFEIFPPYESGLEMLPRVAWGWSREGKTGDGLTADDSNVTAGRNHNHSMGLKDIAEHGAYWTDKNVLTDLRNDLQ